MRVDRALFIITNNCTSNKSGMMKILIINTLYAPYQIGGAEVSVQLLAEQLVGNGHQVKVLCLHADTVSKSDTINSVEVEYLPLKNIYWPFGDEEQGRWKRLFWHALDSYNPFMAKLVDVEIEKFRPDIVHTNNLTGFSVSIWPLIKRKKIKLVHTSRDYYLFHPNTTLFKNGKNIDENSFTIKAISFIKKRMSQHIDDFVGISQFISMFHKKNGFASKANHSYIYNPININSLNVEKQNVIADVISVGFIGRLSVVKGFDEFCNLARKYKDDPGVVFRAAGRFHNDDEGRDMEALAKSCGVELLGFVQVNEFMSSVDAVVLPIKWNEPFGRVVLEAALAGKAVFTTFRGGVTEIAKICPGIYELSNFNMQAIINHRNHSCDTGLPEDFNVDKVADRYVEVYRK
ncbi:sugar transferase, PEP-CTERM/EpsH1 system associated [Serratia proteamaculans]|nr:sugar transferase, PEP-CTERM/EpsH1 system associated [Serratia proteamaculans]